MDCADSIGSSTPATNLPVVIEFNGRVTPAFHLASHSGVDFAKGIAAMLEGETSESFAPARSSPPIYMFPQDLERCIEERDIRGLLKWFTGQTRNDIIPWNDFGLLSYHGRELFGRVISCFPGQADFFGRGRAGSAIWNSGPVVIPQIAAEHFEPRTDLNQRL